MHARGFTVGSHDAPRRVLVFHGYTSAPDEQRELAEVLSERLDAQILLPLLPGHGTSVEDLARYSLDDFLTFANAQVSAIEQEGKPYAIIGHSLGGHFALLAAKQHAPAALVLTVMPFSLRPPFSILGAEWYARLRTSWDKRLSEEEAEERVEYFYYKEMPGIALGILKEANRRVRAALPAIPCPILTINNRDDPTCYPESGETMLKISGGNTENKSVVLDRPSHGLFYGEGHDEVLSLIADFLEKQMKK